MQMSYAFSTEAFLSSYTNPNLIQPAFDLKEDFFDALSIGEIERAADVFADDGVLLFPNVRPMEGRALVKRMLGIIRRRYTSIAWRPIGPVLASNGWLVMSSAVTGTFRVSDLPYENEVLTLVKLDPAGKVAVLSDYFKDTNAFAAAVVQRAH